LDPDVRLRELLARQRISVSELARRAGIARPTVTRLTTDPAAWQSVRGPTLDKIEDALGVPRGTLDLSNQNSLTEGFDRWGREPRGAADPDAIADQVMARLQRQGAFPAGAWGQDRGFDTRGRPLPVSLDDLLAGADRQARQPRYVHEQEDPLQGAVCGLYALGQAWQAWLRLPSTDQTLEALNELAEDHLAEWADQHDVPDMDPDSPVQPLSAVDVYVPKEPGSLMDQITARDKLRPLAWDEEEVLRAPFQTITPRERREDGRELDHVRDAHGVEFYAACPHDTPSTSPEDHVFRWPTRREQLRGAPGGAVSSGRGGRRSPGSVAGRERAAAPANGRGPRTDVRGSGG
jgi:transcriptional regulator with XRE-family HTH domain